MQKKRVAVLDINSKNICAVYGEKNNDNIIVYGLKECNYSGYQNGFFLEEEKLKKTIKNTINLCMQASLSKIEKLYVGVPAHFSYCLNKTVTFDFDRTTKITQKEYNNLILRAQTEILDKNYILLHTGILNIKTDGKSTAEIIGKKCKEVRLELSFVFAEKYFVDKINEILIDMEIFSVEYISLPYVNYRADADNKDLKFAVVQIDYLTTSLVLFENNYCKQISDISVGTAYLAADLSACFNIDFFTAEKLLKEIQLCNKFEKNDVYKFAWDNKIFSFGAQLANSVVASRLEFIGKNLNKIIMQKSPEFKDIKFLVAGHSLLKISGARQKLSSGVGVNLMPFAYQNSIYASRGMASAMSIAQYVFENN